MSEVTREELQDRHAQWKTLVEKWKDHLEGITDHQVRAMTAVLLENQEKACQTMTPGGPQEDL
jgi:hypothetical protein